MAKMNLGYMMGNLINRGAGQVAQAVPQGAAQMVANPVQTLQGGLGAVARPVTGAPPAQRPGSQQTRFAIGPNYMGQTGAAMGYQAGLQNASMAQGVSDINNYGLVQGGLRGTYSMPVAPGSAHGAANSPTQAAALGQYMTSMSNAHSNYNTPTGYRGQIAYNDYGFGPTVGANQGSIGAPGGGAGAGAGGAGGTGSGGAGGDGATSGNPLFEQLLNEYRDQTAAANAANQQRYDQGLSELQSLRARGAADINTLGRTQSQDIRDQTRRQQGELTQNMTGRGLANTTSMPVLSNAINRGAQRSQVALGDTVARQRLDQDSQATRNITDWIYNRNDIAPDYGRMLDLALQYGQSGYGQPNQDLGPLNTGSLQDLLNMLGNGGGGFPQGFAGNVPQYQGMGQQGMQQQQQNGGRPFQMNGPGNGQTGRPLQQGQTQGTSQLQGLLGNAALYGLGSYTPQIAQGLGSYFSSGSNSGFNNTGNYLGSGIAQGAGALGNGIASGLGYLGNLGSQAYRYLLGVPN